MNEAQMDTLITEKTAEVAAAAKPAAKAAPVAADPAKAAPAAEPKPAAAEAPADGADGEGDEGDDSPEGRTPWPKTAVNAMSRRDKKLNQLKAEKAERDQKLNDAAYLEQRLAELKGGNKPAGKAPQGNPADPEPDITKYDDWDKYQSDLRAWDRRQVAAELKGTLTETQKAEQQDALIADRAKIAATQAQEVIAKNPEFLDVVQQNADIIDAFPNHVQHALLQADNATLAVVVLANEGTLEDLAEMSPALAEKTIKAAQLRGLALVKSDEGSDPADAAAPAAAPAKKVSAAPAPMKAAKSAIQSGPKSPKNMNDTEFRKEFFA